MGKTQQWLLALVACFYCNTLFAQVDLVVNIRGVDDSLEKNVRLYLSLEQQKESVLLTEGRVKRLHDKASQEISNALKPYGYYRSEVSSELTKSDAGQWQASYTIDKGPPLRVTEFRLLVDGELRQDPALSNLIADLPLQEGSVFNHIQYESIKSDLTRLASERGYFQARFVEKQVKIDLDAYEARVNLHYESGPRYRFGDVSLQQDVLDPQLLQRYIPFERGDPYNLNEVIDLQYALNDSDYFSRVEVSPGEIDETQREVPVNVKLTPRKPHRYTLGVGYGTDTGARTRFGWEMPRLNKSGHRINTEVGVSEIGYSFGARYRVPVLDPRTDQLIYSAGVINEETDTSESTLRTLGVALNRSRGQWRESMALNYQQEEFIVAGDEGDSTLLIPGVDWSRTWGQGFVNVLDGLRFDIEFRGASEKLISDTDFFQVQGGLKGITSLGSKTRLIGRGRLGSTRTDEFNQLPSSVRFFAGGSQSVRGYAYESLGPVDDTGQVVGGKHLMVGSIELERNLGGKWGMAVFYDAGNAINNLDDELEHGAGFGLRWKSPIGPVRIDVASAITQPGDPWRLHINIGPDL
ncbi:autotransporter assembly complex protein TamA [Thiohalophilus thiocyanatoxydans]|uniref:Translocation and assembly module subunit TamA n=1 Tax=Thiohalophilus thiocyanatoxydans TaxID=381308 RepID=A0A4R8IF10_9GAMM|nr:autotransporter assembly complex family protein [Thiohalophilus thiocyanatoxydans]TDX98179.1 translocation and assembly module TamA [Thiohalophilus thiocyanatoxydans]